MDKYTYKAIYGESYFFPTIIGLGVAFTFGVLVGWYFPLT